MNPVQRKTLSPEQWERIVPIFSEALEILQGERDAFLEKACPGEPALIGELRRLLSENDSASKFLDAPLLAPSNPSRPSTPAPHVFQPGQILSGRFSIIGLLGAGGMGEVYEARDSELKEFVAIKTLKSSLLSDPEMVERFRAEVQRSRRVVHRCVCRVHDLFNYSAPGGQSIPFFTMQLLRGKTLADHLRDHGPFDEQESLALIRHVAAALQTSHEEGLIHRDLKPGNIFLISEGSLTRAIVTDFGLATQTRSIAEIRDLDSTGIDSIFAAGTPAYMAPEQMDSQALTPQTDVYALGLVAAEMRSGLPVFAFQSPILCAVRKLSAVDPLSPQHLKCLSPDWAKAIRRSLDRDPSKRFASASAFVSALNPVSALDSMLPPGSISRRAALLSVCVGIPASVYQFSSVSEPKVRVIAVLPFENATGDPSLDYFADGVAEEIIQSLASYSGIRVVARNSAFRYRATREPLPKVATALGASSILTGSIRRTVDRVRVSVQLIDAGNENTLWSDIYDRDLRQILVIQTDIQNQIAAKLNLRASALSARSQQTSNVVAYDHYLIARRNWNSRTKEGLTTALAEFHSAVTIDSSYAAAYTGIADSHTVMIDYGLVPTLASLPLAKAAVDRAISLDPNLAEAYAAAGLLNCIAQWDQPAAERAFLRSLQLKPSLLTAHHWYGGFLMRSGRLDEALTHATEASKLDPLSLPSIVFLGWVHHYRREYDKALVIGDQAIQLDAKFPHAYQLKALAYAAKGDHANALAASDTAVRGITDPAVAIRFRALALSVLPGLEAEARGAAERLAELSKDRQAAYLAIIYAGLRDTSRMFEWIDRALQIRDSSLLFINIDRATLPYRNDPRFRLALRQIGYAPAA